MVISLKKRYTKKNFYLICERVCSSNELTRMPLKFFFIVTLFLILSCAQAKDFSHGLKLINSLNSKYNTTMETYPKDLLNIDFMLKDFEELGKIQLTSGQEPLQYIIDYRIFNLEAEILYIKGQKYGNAGTTKYGFGCKPRPLIIESVSLRNSSSLKGFEAVNLLKEFVEKYPNEANSAGLSSKNVLFLNATFYTVWRDARKDSNTINYFCPINVTLDLYKQEFRKRTNLTEEYINNLDYEQSVKIWKKIREIE